MIVIIPEQGAAFRIRSASGAALIRKEGKGRPPGGYRGAFSEGADNGGKARQKSAASFHVRGHRRPLQLIRD